MKINFFKYFILFLGILFSLIIYLSVVGIETEKFNKQIKDKIIKTNKNLDFELNKIKLILDPLNFKINLKTVGTTIFYSKRPLQLEYIQTQISLVSLFKNKFISSNLEISTKSIMLKDLIRFLRATNNTPQLFIFEKIIKKGHVILKLNLHFDENGNIKNDYRIKGLLKDGKIDLLKNNIFENINFNFDLYKNNYLFQNIKFSANKINFISELLNIKKKKDSFLVEGSFENSKSILDKNFLKLFKVNIKNVDLENINFTSKNKFSLEIDNKLNFKNPILNSDVTIDQIKYKKIDLINNYFPDINEIILLKNQKLKIEYSKKILSVKGKGEIQVEKKFNEIEYSIYKDKNDFKFKSNLNLDSINLKKNLNFKGFFSTY